MSRGLCVVAADNSGAHDIIRHGVNGMLAPTGCMDMMVRHCLELIKNHAVALSISNAAAITAQAYTWDRVAEETESFYQNRIEAKARSAF